MRRRPLVLWVCFILMFFCLNVNAHESERSAVVKKKQRWTLFETEYGDVSAANVSGRGGRRYPGAGEVQAQGYDYHLQFFTLEPNALFLPVLLHSDMVFYVHSGSGSLSWVDQEEDMNRIDLKRGDVFRLQPGSVFSVQSNLEPDERQKLRLYAIFSNTDKGTYEPLIGAYSSIGDLVRGFNRKALQSAFQVPEDVIEALKSVTRPPPIVHALEQKEEEKKKKSVLWEMETRFLKDIMSDEGDTLESINKKKKKDKETKSKAFNVFDEKPDFQNCNGWSTTVNQRDLKSLSGSNMGVFMVNLTNGSMMGPHWNPAATEIAIVLQGQGMIRVVCPITRKKESGCKNMRFRVEEGDVFAVPRFHPMAQMSFNNNSFVFMGFSTTTKTNYPQFLAGARSVLRTLEKEVLALSFNVGNATVDKLLTMQEESVILECTSCAEEEESVMEEEKGRKREEEERERKEEEARKREEEGKRREEERERAEEEKVRKKEEEERKKREKEEKEREEEEERKSREEEERERKEEKERMQREKEERERQKAEEEREREEEEERKRREKEEEEREEEEAREQREEEEWEEEEKKRKRKEKEERESEGEEATEREEEAAAKEAEKRRERQHREEEEAAARQEEERRAREKQEKAAKEKERREEEEEREPENEPAEEEQEPEKRRIVKVKLTV